MVQSGGDPQIRDAANPNSKRNNLLRINREGEKSGSAQRGRDAKSNSTPSQVCFDRQELNQLLRVYGFAVARGEWRDYAIDMLKERAVFSVFRSTSENPLFAIEKNPKLARRQGAYSIANANGHILKRGHDLAQLLRYFDKKPKLVSV